MTNSETTQILASSTLVSKGLVDFRGNTADKRKTGGWKSASYVIVEEMVEKLCYYAIVTTLGNYFHYVMHIKLTTSMNRVTNWVGSGQFLALVGAFVADAYLGRFMTIFIGSIIYAGGMVMLTLAATQEGYRPPPNRRATEKQESFLCLALTLISIGMGGIKPCVSAFGADQFDAADPTEAKKKYTFFSWFFLAINMGAILGIGGASFVQQRKGPGWGYGVPAVMSVLSIIVIAAGYRSYRFQKPMGSPFTRFAQVIVAAWRNRRKTGELYESKMKGSYILRHTEQYKFLDKAAVPGAEPAGENTSNRWKLCTVTQVEEFKCIVRLMPIVITTTTLAISFSQLPTYFTSQSTIMHRSFKKVTVPPGAVTIFATLNPIIVIPIYMCVIVPILHKYTGHARGLTSLQRIGVGNFISIFAMGIAAMVEKRRLIHPHPASMSFLWLVPQIFLMGTAEVFAFIGQLEFFYDESSQGTRSISTAIVICQGGFAHFLSTGIVQSLETLSGGTQKGWFQDDLNKSRLDYFYWVLCGINAVNFVFYLWAAYAYNGRDDAPVWDEEEGLAEGY